MTKKSNPNNSSTKVPRIVINTAQVLQSLSPKLATKFAARLFSTPIKHKIPQRELQMDKNSVQKKMFIPKINKTITVYEYGTGEKQILLVHGWSGRGTQLVKIADELIKNHYKIISFDAPAHGKSSSKTTLMIEFIECIIDIERQYGTFYAAVGHSLGGMALYNTINWGLKIEKLITIGAGNSITEITQNFVSLIELPNSQVKLLKDFFEKKYQLKMDNFASDINAAKIDIPVLIIHDEDDEDVPVKCAYEIKEKLKNSTMVITQKLGHRKILGDATVVKYISSFVNKV